MNWVICLSLTIQQITRFPIDATEKARAKTPRRGVTREKFVVIRVIRGYSS
jgi:hypothetical protein